MNELARKEHVRNELALGIDIGTSGVRSAVVDAAGNVLSSARAGHAATSHEDANAWWDAVARVLEAQVTNLRSIDIDPKAITRASVDGTSGSMVLVDGAVNPATPALMYHSSGFDAEAEIIAQHAEPASITRGTSSALARMLRLQSLDQTGNGTHLLHQADFVIAKLAGQAVGSDDNNALKLGWDPETRAWPTWLGQAGVRTSLLPDVRPAGAAIGPIDPAIADQFGFLHALTLHAGTTDSIAAFLASGANQVGDAVTSLGTTLAIKLLSDVRVDDPASGIYSHLVGGMWLAGGASNTGGGVLAAHFSADELAALSAQIDPSTASDLDYYPLIKPGERFPINDPNLAPRMGPRPASDAAFLHGLMESIARIEAQGYGKLCELGAPAPKRMFTAGGGAKNPVWSAIRSRHSDAQFQPAREIEAAVGTALLALRNTR
ncbi:MAG: FGGY-family carbohydrate kinase [Devosiaceae bacterium]